MNFPTIHAWYQAAQQNHLVRFNYTSANFQIQLKIDRRTQAVILVLIEIDENHRGQGLGSRLMRHLDATYGLIVDCPQPRLEAWCVRNGIAVTEC